MKNQLLNKRIPTIFGIILILIGIPLTTLVLRSQTNLQSKASDSQKPQNIKISNISYDSFTVTYQTDAPATGSISYGYNKKLGGSGLEDVDKEKGSFTSKKVHNISIKKLTPATKYYLTIISGSDTFLNNGAPFEVMTGPSISSSSAKSASASAKQNNIRGKIVLPDGSTPSEAEVYLNAEDSQLLSSAIGMDGAFSFSLKNIRTSDLSSYFNVTDNTIFKIFATDGSLKSTALFSLNQSDSIPTMTLSNDYDFTQETSLIASESAKSSGFPPIISPKKNLKPEIINPKENESLSDPKPLFRGTSLPNGKIEIIIHSDEQITTQITADSNGNWTYKPSTNLSPGAHTITIKTRDSSGILTTIMQSFTVFAAEAQIPTPTATLISPTPTLTQAPTPTSTPAISLTSVPSFFPTPTEATSPTKGGLPPTGSSPIPLIIGGIAAAIAGLTLFLLTNKSSL